tara:strand:+ start:1548 stop:1964 length:417 start_codon:yes stop_codon:yes gene_type:complete
MQKTFTYMRHTIIRKNDKVTLPVILRIGKYMTMELADVEAAVAFIDDSMLQSLKSHAQRTMDLMGVGKDWQLKTSHSRSNGDRRKSGNSEGLHTVLYSFSIREECYTEMLHFDEMMTYLTGLKHGAETTLALREKVSA